MTRYDVHLMLIGKLVGDFLLVIIELFSLGAFILSQFMCLTDRGTDFTTANTKLHTMQCGKKNKKFQARVGDNAV